MVPSFLGTMPVAIGAERCYRRMMFDLPGAAEAAPHEGARPVASRSRMALVRPALLAAGLVLAGLSFRMVPRALDPALIDRFVGGHGLAGALLFVVAAAAACAVGMPRQAAAFAGGYVFGVTGGAALALLAQVVGCAVDFGWARVVARPWAARRMRGRLARWEAFIAARPFRTILTLRLLPVGNNLLLNLLAGASRVSPRPFLMASAFGYLPQTVVFALLGGGVRVAHSVQIGLGAALLAASTVLGACLLRSGPRS